MITYSPTSSSHHNSVLPVAVLSSAQTCKPTASSALVRNRQMTAFGSHRPLLNAEHFPWWETAAMGPLSPFWPKPAVRSRQGGCWRHQGLQYAINSLTPLLYTTWHMPWQDCFQSKKSECCLSHLHHRSYMHPQILFKVDFWPDKQFDSGYCYCHRTSCGSSHFTLASCFALPNCRSHLWLKWCPGSLHVNARALRIDFFCTLAPKQIGRQETAGVPTHLGRLVLVCCLHLWNASVDECLILVGEA